MGDLSLHTQSFIHHSFLSVGDRGIYFAFWVILQYCAIYLLLKLFHLWRLGALSGWPVRCQKVGPLGTKKTSGLPKRLGAGACPSSSLNNIHSAKEWRGTPLTGLTSGAGGLKRPHRWEPRDCQGTVTAQWIPAWLVMSGPDGLPLCHTTPHSST